MYQVDIYSLSRKWKELVDKARAKQLQPQEYNTGIRTICSQFLFNCSRYVYQEFLVIHVPVWLPTMPQQFILMHNVTIIVYQFLVDILDIQILILLQVMNLKG